MTKIDLIQLALFQDSASSQLQARSRAKKKVRRTAHSLLDNIVRNDTAHSELSNTDKIRKTAFFRTMAEFEESLKSNP